MVEAGDSRLDGMNIGQQRPSDNGQSIELFTERE